MKLSDRVEALDADHWAALVQLRDNADAAGLLWAENEEERMIVRNLMDCGFVDYVLIKGQCAMKMRAPGIAALRAQGL